MLDFTAAIINHTLLVYERVVLYMSKRRRLLLLFAGRTGFFPPLAAIGIKPGIKFLILWDNLSTLAYNHSHYDFPNH